ncbi:MAG TPA: hypothetical protein VK957_04555 [Lunatimonas sp.]|nr:hypothetical protein [Lunatimonas sp.]
METKEGIWQFAYQEDFDGEKDMQLNEHFTFLYKDGTVTLRLVTMHPGIWKSEDDFYKLKAKFEKNTLYYLPPFGNWAKLAIFDNNHFVDIGNGKRRVFERISKDKVVKWNLNILKENRELHNYRISPDGVIR